MAKIESILSYSNFELIRSRIASILADELANQKALNVAALALEEAKPTIDQDPALIAFYNLNIDSIPSKVWEERFIHPQPDDYPMINVVFTNAPLNQGTSVGNQIGENKYQIECYQHAKDSDTENGDVLASLKLHRLLAISRMILMDVNYDMLGFSFNDKMVGYRQCQDIVIAQPNKGAADSWSSIYGKMDVLVKTTEHVNNLDGVPLNISGTTLKINDTEKGYYWEVVP